MVGRLVHRRKVGRDQVNFKVAPASTTSSRPVT
jgi:hypothetical protein